MKKINCEHYNDEGYTYDIYRDIELNLCDMCGKKLMSQVLKQTHLETECDLIALETKEKK